MLVVDWDRINNLYKQGMTINQLSDEFNIKKKTIHNKLSKEYPKSRAVHKQMKRQLRMLNKKECKKYMGDLEVIKRNRSIFTTNIKGVYLNTDSSIPIDIPRELKNSSSGSLKKKRFNLKNYLKLRKGDVVTLEHLDDELSELSKYRLLDKVNYYNLLKSNHVVYETKYGNIKVFFKKVDRKNLIKILNIEFKSILN